MSGDGYERRFPGLPWREPVEVTVIGDEGAAACWLCRVCIARDGLKGEEVASRGFAVYSDCAEHVATHFSEAA